MMMNNIAVIQTGNSQYTFYTETNICLGIVVMPDNGQYMFDCKVLDVVTKAMALRWGLISQPKKRVSN